MGELRPATCCPTMAEHLADAEGAEGIVYQTGGGIPDGFYCWGCCHGGCFVLSALRFCPWCAWLYGRRPSAATSHYQTETRPMATDTAPALREALRAHRAEVETRW